MTSARLRTPSPAFGSLTVFDGPEALAGGAAAWLAARAEEASGRFTICLSGGTTPRRLYQLMAAPPWRDRFPWARMHFAFGDERFVPADDPASNLGMVREALFRHVPVPRANIHAVPTDAASPEAAAALYERALLGLRGASADRPLFDATLLGLGEDGHTASLLPGEPVLEERSRLVAAVAHGRPEPRVTLTYPALESSATVLFLVQGEGKRAVLDRILSGDEALPAACLRPAGPVLWLADRAAAGRWKTTAEAAA